MPDLFPLPHTKKYQAEREVEINVLSPADIKEVWLCVLRRVKTLVLARENTLTHRQTPALALSLTAPFALTLHNPYLRFLSLSTWPRLT